jgi:hypothetical protein
MCIYGMNFGFEALAAILNLALRTLKADDNPPFQAAGLSSSGSNSDQNENH